MLILQPIDFKEACDFVSRYHRHHRPPVGAKYSIAVNDGQSIVGVAICGRPVARMLDDGLTIEVARVCTTGVRNACSILYGACARVAKAQGYRKIITYTLPSEGGASLRAAGWVLTLENAGGGLWIKSGVVRNNDWPIEQKHRYELILNQEARRFRVHADMESNHEQSLFD